MKIFVVSLGCSKNLVDTEVMLGFLTRSGCRVIDEPAQADCLLVNTCSFLLDAVEESLDSIMVLARWKTQDGPKRLVVTGCLVSRYGEEILKEIPEVDALVHPANLESVVEAVFGRSQRTRSPRSGLTTLDSGLSFPFPPRVLSFPSHRAYLKIGEGCSNRCSFCLIPSLRGEFESRSPDSLRAEIKHLLQAGAREITLVAQDSGRFGMDTGEGSLPVLLNSLLSVTSDLFWLRVLYIHPRRVTDELIRAVGSDERICRYLDIPFQHASPRILEKMGRSDAPPPLETVEKVRDLLPGVFLRTTLMTGFPGETGKDFEQVLEFLGKARVDHLGVFPYSREEGTLAAVMDGQVDPDVARERAQILMQEQALISSEKLSMLIGKEMTVLVEGLDEDGPWGRHQGQAPEVDGVVRLNREVEAGSFVNVRITGSGDYDLEGEII